MGFTLLNSFDIFNPATFFLKILFLIYDYFSAVDVDAAVCLASEADQLPDIVELIYRLRHTENTADLLPSTEYTVYRLLLKHDNQELFYNLLNDPINYGVFMNEHAYCIAIDHFIKQDNFAGKQLGLFTNCFSRC